MTEETGHGLLSRVFGFGKSPKAVAPAPALVSQDGSPSEQMLKEMMERKRRNDAVRKREFDMLREIRRKQLVGSHDPAARSSVFHSTLQSKSQDRASTILKINEIEAQMSMHWWKANAGGQPGDSRKGGVAKGAIDGAKIPSASAEATASSNFQTTQAVGIGFSKGAPLVVAPPVSAAQQEPAQKAGPAEAEAKDSFHFESGFSQSRQSAIEVEDLVHDPELEEAAIRFANGDESGAEACLLEATGETGARRKHLETWMTLFDLYRAIGQRERFEKLALDFLTHFDRSAPQWFSMPEQVTLVTPSKPAATPAAGRPSIWTAPVMVTESTLAGLRTVLARIPSGAPWQMDWSRLAAVDAAAVPALRALMDEWAAQPVQFLFAGAGQLDSWLANATPSGDASVDQALWMLRMAWLRLTQRVDDFESVALDYCVTYEMSPPSWESPRSNYRSLDSDAADGQTIIGDFSDSSEIAAATTMMPDHDGMPLMRQAAIELSGKITGDASQTLEKMEARFKDADLMTISCAKLIRVDFSAAGSLLNWASGHQALGHRIQFVGTHRLVAVFFHVIGINEMAHVVPRND